MKYAPRRWTRYTSVGSSAGVFLERGCSRSAYPVQCVLAVAVRKNTSVPAAQVRERDGGVACTGRV